MAVDPVELRLKFLQRAAQSLNVSSPAVSGNLGAAHNNLLTANDRDIETVQKDWDALRRNDCGACGNIMVPGWSSAVSHQSRSGRKRSDQTKTSKPLEKQIVYTCLRCDRKTFQMPPSRPSKHIRAQVNGSIMDAAPVKETKKPVIEDQNKITKSSNATSKQRKKARKGGLQAMLHKNKPTSTGPGLDLMDFMQ